MQKQKRKREPASAALTRVARKQTRGAMDSGAADSVGGSKRAASKKGKPKAGASKKARGAAKARSSRPVRIARMKPHEHPVGNRQEHVPGLLVVKCEEDVVANVPDVQSAHVASVRAMALPKAVETPFDNLQKNDLLREVIPVFSRLTRGRSLSIAPTSVAASFATSVRDSENEDLRGINVLRLSRSADLKKVEKELKGTRGIEYVHRVPRRWITATRPLPNDPLAAQQWGLRSIRWTRVDPRLDASTVKVGVLDTGVDITHPDLRDVVNAYVHLPATGKDIIGHGTHVSGIISAEMNNREGISGVCQCDLNVWKIFTDQPDPDDGEYYVDDVMYQRALNAARNAGMRVINLSIGGTAHSRTEEFLFRRLINAGCTVVAAMGNEFEEGNPTEYPGAYSGVIAVGATNRNNRRASFSNTGRHISISAPGFNIISTLPMEPSAARTADEIEYAIWSGTSMATPHVAAAAALLIAKDPNLSPQQVAQRLKSTATKVTAMGGRSFTNEFGHGLLNLEGVLS
ncbi:MAG TPA: S8 family serine peptidase [Blastocatellia bacterium]|nr:S8 family serine peptidase [Blastocatellia bacterium]